MKHLLLLLFCSALVHAARPPEWLRLPDAADTRPSGASAWVLYDTVRITQEDAKTAVLHIRFAIMPLSEAGIKKAVCDILYTDKSDKLVSARAWAMSPDGKKCREFGGSEFLIYSPTVSNWTWDQTKSVHFEAERCLQPGWILAFEVEIRLETMEGFDFRWSPRSPLPIRFAAFEVIPEKGGAVKWQAFSRDLPSPTAGGAAGSLIWQVPNLPGYPENIPEGMETNSVELGVRPVGPNAAGAASESWADVVSMVRGQMDPKMTGTPAIEAEARRLAGTGNLWSRIEPVCRFVQKQISYLAITIDTDSLAGCRPHEAREVFENRYGDCKDKAVLLCTMLRAIGVGARVMLVNSGHPMTNVLDWPSVRFNHAIVAIEYGDGENTPQGSTVVRSGNLNYVLFDPTNEIVPLGRFPNYNAGGLGLILAPNVTSAVQIPVSSPAAETESVSVDTVLAEDGSAKIEIAEERSGLAAAESIDQDETVLREKRTGELENRVQRRVPLIADLTWESSGDSKKNRWSSHTRFSAQYVGKRTSGGMYVNTDLMSVVPSADPWEGEIDGWLTFKPVSTRREIKLTVPAGWKITEIPPDWSVKTAAGEASMHYSEKDGILNGEIDLRIEGGVLDRQAYLGLRDLVRASTMAERRPVMLKSPPKPAPAPAPASAPAAAK
jgi:hypothetical protein